MANQNEPKTSSLWTAFVGFLTRRGWEWWLGFALLLGIIFLLMYSASHNEFSRTAAVCLLIAGAASASASGILVGFLFGIPRIVQRDASQSGVSRPIAQIQSTSLGINTNLTEISDWLTKIIVGVGLVQLNSIPNGAAERAIRPLAIGRGNWLHVGGDDGLKTTSVLLSICASSTRHRLNPWPYLREVLDQLAARSDSDDVGDLLPDAWAIRHARTN